MNLGCACNSSKSEVTLVRNMSMYNVFDRFFLGIAMHCSDLIIVTTVQLFVPTLTLACKEISWCPLRLNVYVDDCVHSFQFVFRSVCILRY